MMKSLILCLVASAAMTVQASWSGTPQANSMHCKPGKAMSGKLDLDQFGTRITHRRDDMFNQILSW